MYYFTLLSIIMSPITVLLFVTLIGTVNSTNIFVCDNTIQVTLTDKSPFGNNALGATVRCIDEFIKTIDYQCNANDTYVDKYQFDYRVPKAHTNKIATIDVTITGTVPVMYAETVETGVSTINCPSVTRDTTIGYVVIVCIFGVFILGMVVYNIHRNRRQLQETVIQHTQEPDNMHIATVV